MALAPGSKLGVYEVTAKIGAGGMGEVYRAHDTTLDRDVAIKVLPDAFATDPERLARFEREAKVLASLNHPNIAAIYGLEKSADTRALILELVEGPTLQERISQGPIPLDEALPIARQIAEALEGHHPRPVRSPLRHRCGRHGGGVSGQGHEARPQLALKGRSVGPGRGVRAGLRWGLT